MHYHLTLQSTNAKTGPIPVSTQSKETYPLSCPLVGNGCYAELGPLRLFWDKVSSNTLGTSFEEFCRAVSRLPRGQLWRYGQAGDLPGNGEIIDGPMLLKLARANRNRPVIAFTHKPPSEENLIALRQARTLGFPVNLSANNLNHIDELAEHGLPIVTVLPSEYARRRAGKKWQETIGEYRKRLKKLDLLTPKGKRVAVCPATYTDTSCAHCKVCSTERNGVVIGFPAHGAQKLKVDEILRTLPTSMQPVIHR
jgi:hypothetical protein